MAITYSSITDVSEMHASYEESIAVEGEVSQTITLRVPWENRYDVAVDIVGLGRLWPQSLIGTVANRCVIRPEPGDAVVDGQGLVYQYALLQVTYDFLKQGQKEETTDPISGQTVLYSETIEPSWFSQQVWNNALHWGAFNGPALTKEETVDKRWERCKFVRTLYGMPEVPPFFGYIGKTNDAPYYSSILDMTFAAETLLFVPPHLERTITASGSKGWNIRVAYDFAESGWNKYWHTTTQTFQQIFLGDGTQYKNYPPVSMVTMALDAAKHEDRLGPMLWDQSLLDKLKAAGKLPEAKPKNLHAWARLLGTRIIDHTANLPATNAKSV